ncbi:hypothetical protein CP49_08065 [Bradyrhizobium valentinum]|uniref:Uncharacterized protein n=1 Tax=Bradyrhizobium valentinum TaxID=1518501 RepID=A0A0R3LXF7_9BRAD|nr:hypothetical protein [Bradyrhizobium valentinum]KRR12379.1 hypothetical protein CP49_08065 [Bradyrhizobium valentinum]
MIERSEMRNEARYEREDGAGLNGKTITQGWLRRRQRACDEVPDTQGAVDRYLLSTLACIIPGRIRVSAVDAKHVSGRRSRWGKSGGKDAGQNDVENERVGRDERSHHAHLSSENEPRHPLDPKSGVSQLVRESNPAASGERA